VTASVVDGNRLIVREKREVVWTSVVQRAAVVDFFCLPSRVTAGAWMHVSRALPCGSRASWLRCSAENVLGSFRVGLTLHAGMVPLDCCSAGVRFGYCGPWRNRLLCERSLACRPRMVHGGFPCAFDDLEMWRSGENTVWVRHTECSTLWWRRGSCCSRSHCVDILSDLRLVGSETSRN
jgi:hypothetical protein